MSKTFTLRLKTVDIDVDRSTGDCRLIFIDGKNNAARIATNKSGLVEIATVIDKTLLMDRMSESPAADLAASGTPSDASQSLVFALAIAVVDFEEGGIALEFHQNSGPMLLIPLLYEQALSLQAALAQVLAKRRQ